MRIAIVANTAWYLYNFRLNLIESLIAQGHEVIAVAPYDQYADRIVARGIVFEKVEISGKGMNPFLEISSVWRLNSIFSRRKVRLVLSYTPKGNLYCAFAALPLRTQYVPNVSGLGSVFTRRTAVTRLVEVLYKLTFRRARKVFFQNNDDLNYFVERGFVSKERSERLPGSGVDLSRFTYGRHVPAQEGERRSQSVVFLLVGRVLWDKGVGEFVEASRLVRVRHPSARFLILGSAGAGNPSAVPEAVLKQWVADGDIEYMGSTDDVRPLMLQADCVVLPSYREGVPRSLLEAAALARPIVTTDAPGCRDTVMDGATGFLCKVRDARDLADKMAEMIELGDSGRELMGEKARRFVEENFDERIVLRRYLDLVNNMDQVDNIETPEINIAETDEDMVLR